MVWLTLSFSQASPLQTSPRTVTQPRTTTQKFPNFVIINFDSKQVSPFSAVLKILYSCLLYDVLGRILIEIVKWPGKVPGLLWAFDNNPRSEKIFDRCLSNSLELSTPWILATSQSGFLKLDPGLIIVFRAGSTRVPSSWICCKIFCNKLFLKFLTLLIICFKYFCSSCRMIFYMRYYIRNLLRRPP